MAARHVHCTLHPAAANPVCIRNLHICRLQITYVQFRGVCPSAQATHNTDIEKWTLKNYGVCAREHARACACVEHLLQDAQTLHKQKTTAHAHTHNRTHTINILAGRLCLLLGRILLARAAAAAPSPITRRPATRCAHAVPVHTQFVVTNLTLRSRTTIYIHTYIHIHMWIDRQKVMEIYVSSCQDHEDSSCVVICDRKFVLHTHTHTHTHMHAYIHICGHNYKSQAAQH